MLEVGHKNAVSMYAPFHSNHVSTFTPTFFNSFSEFFIRPQKFCGRIMLWRCRRCHSLWKYGFCAISLVVGDRML